MILKFETDNKTEFDSLRDLFSSMIKARFPEHICQICLVEIGISTSDDARVPYRAALKVNDIAVSAVSSNVISAFTQAVNRLEVKLSDSRMRA